jgi:uncharacterized protein (DUF1778 family)
MSNKKLNKLKEEAIKNQAQKQGTAEKTSLLGIRVTPEEKEAIQAAAYKAGYTNVSEYVRRDLEASIRRGRRLLSESKTEEKEE